MPNSCSLTNSFRFVSWTAKLKTFCQNSAFETISIHLPGSKYTMTVLCIRTNQVSLENLN